MNDRPPIILLKGGTGKQIALSSVLSLFFQSHLDGKLIVDRPEIFLHHFNEEINVEVISSRSNNLFDIIREHNLLVLDPYLNYKVYREHKSIVSVSSYLLNGKEEYIKPKIFLSEEEISWGYDYIKQYTSDFSSCILFLPYGNSYDYASHSDPSFRSLTKGFAEKCVEIVKKDFCCFILRKDWNTNLFGGIDVKFFDFRKLASITFHIDKIVTCDTVMNHLAPALDKTALVLFSSTSESIFGHPSNINIREQESGDFIPSPFFHLFTSNKVDLKDIKPSKNTFSSITLDKIKNYIY